MGRPWAFMTDVSHMMWLIKSLVFGSFAFETKIDLNVNKMYAYMNGRKRQYHTNCFRQFSAKSIFPFFFVLILKLEMDG